MIKKKIIILVLIAVIIFVGLLYLISDKILVKSFEEIESSQMLENLTRASQVVDNYSSFLRKKSLDWSQWDDTYYFAIDGNEEYIESNLVSGTLVNLEVNFIAILNNNDEIVSSIHVDLENGEELPSENLVREIVAKLRNSPPKDGEPVKGGILIIQDKLLFVEELEILTSDGEGPSTGTIFFARFLDDKLVEDFVNLAQLDIQFSDLLRRDDNVTKGFSIDTTREDFIGGSFPVYNTENQAASIVSIEYDRDVLNQGKKTIIILTTITGVMLLLLGIVILLIFGGVLLRRLSLLSKDVESIKIEDLSKSKVNEGKDDEVGTVARKINLLLETLSKSQAEEEKAKNLEKKARADLENSLKETKEMNELMTGRELKMIELKKEIDRLKKHKTGS